MGSYGNSRNPKSEYLRTPNFVMQEANEVMKLNKPKMVFEDLKRKYNEVTHPSSIQQLWDKRNMKKLRINPLIFKKQMWLTKLSICAICMSR